MWGCRYRMVNSMHELKQPVRVIRGPKCAGGYGTADTGGGYRYDGMFDVTKAVLEPTGPRGLLTALFHLSKVAE